ncbi:MAG: hypothetical protein JXB26_02390 [Candidatus Aminicenantes bacterium]|nr:hypothetical protein [Candidatus Aminicenantes bacterium]
MKQNVRSFGGAIFALFLFFLFPGTSAGAAQKVPISFDTYHGYTGTVQYLQAVAKAYPDITQLMEIGRSTMGRPVYVLVVTNRQTGTTIDRYVELRFPRKEGIKNVPPMTSDMGKPGHWICGSTHGNEFTGTEVCLYIIDKLVTGYVKDEEIKEMVDGKVFYICPVINPDGVFNSVEKGITQRANSMNRDDDGDGRVNEDGPDDLDGDGHITRFRWLDSEGQYVKDEQDPRLMIRLRRGEKTDKPRYSVINEDRDNDGDGKRGEDPESGIDLNRNFPEGWFRPDGFAGGSGDYPTSAPETHAVAEFFTTHRNILMGQYYHTSGGFTFRPMGTAPHPQLHPKDVAVFDFIMGKKYLEIIGEEVPEAWISPEKINDFKEELEKTSKNKYAAERGYVLPRGWRVSYNEDRDQRYSYGMATDWMYKQLGIYSITTELWNPEKDIENFPECNEENGRIQRARSLLKIQDERYGGRLFVPWKKYKHPELGEGEIGGWIPQYRGNNALPGKPLLNVCDMHWRFELFRAKLLPEVVIADARARTLTTASGGGEASVVYQGDQVTVKRGASKGSVKIVEVTADIENRGKLATHLAQGARLPGNREDVVWLIGERGKVTFLHGRPFQELGVLEGTLKIPGYRERGGPSPQQNERRRMMMVYYRGMRFQAPIPNELKEREQPRSRPQTGSRRKVRWLVAVEGDTMLQVVVTSQKGGTQAKELRIR